MCGVDPCRTIWLMRASRVLVGRAAKLAVLDRALGDVRGGRGSVVLVGGPAGIGKTSLVTDH